MALPRSAALLLPLLALACAPAQRPHPNAALHRDRCAHELAQGDLVKAEAECDLGLEYSPKDGDLWVNKGLIALKDGRKQDAKAAFVRAIRFNQEQLQAYQNLGVLYFEEGAYSKAAESFTRALKVDPAFNEARFNLGLAYMRLAEKDADYRRRARAELHKILAVNPELSDAHHALGELAFGEQDLQAAAAEFRTAVQLSPEHATAWHDLGVTLLQLRQYPQATEAFQECIAHAGDPSCAQGLEAARRAGN
ncbi:MULTISPECIES: tetratricopeptide repeat protein [Myxococcaceae]|uniref:tetratricopeptide repeat protein n=1 Tax=Myxococcaceae TaxID=31 RepID=UPI00188F9BB2|nr:MULTISPECIES: tetratricopeptide repeat protein [Myxococcaceae]MBF5044881.1 tetratricopeptide repeat protein [Simulacricoccus sp. 17bor-14]